ncbi:uncharacterized protein LOC132725397 [Ruditapes philippinarum]|uniref:uncharacterized protein LOC132725397 n=1 Tax=Ruditapes philippinarum TaxID=129788 RepID=UPI00295C1F2A|nr:uncharacterized protein LOC132725397 [Ruditapes philippinarum]XP_060566487.1 uncharacterized protein LOC132725397 [Ruditapes philippinarum]
MLPKSLLAAILFCHSIYLAHAQSTPTPSTIPGRVYEMEKDDLILLNVAAKGRVVELLADELARTEIIRALLVEYGRECVENVTLLEKHCLDCMMDRCSNRMSECHIDGPPLSEVINHSPSPIQGLQFLSNSPRVVNEGMKKFAKRARTDILKDVPETLREEGEAIMHAEVDQSLQDLKENMQTEKALQKLSLHVQKAADNVKNLPDVGDKLGTIIVENEDHAINLAELLARRLKSSRPFLESINHNGARVIEQMPSVLDKVGERVKVFKEKVSGVFNKVLDTFHTVINDPETPVMNGNLQQQNVMSQNQNPNQQIGGIQFQSQQGIFRGMSSPRHQQFNPQQFRQPQGGQWPAVLNNPAQFNQGQTAPNQQFNQIRLPPPPQNMNPAFNPNLPQHRQVNQIPGSTVPSPGHVQAGRRRRHTDPDCKRLKDDPDTYCRTYESLCHNCTLEKRLRFEVCGDGVEKARDEIKRMDKSVENYLKAYEDYIAGDNLVFKVELNTTNRLHKTNSFFDAFVTAKIGPSIFRYTTKMILNIDDIRSTGLQIGDELWEKLWENNVFEEARKPEIVPQTFHIMGQVHIKDVHQAHAHSQETGSASLPRVGWTSFISVLFALVFIFV